MNKKFFKFSLTLNIVFAMISIIFSLIYFFYSASATSGDGFVVFLEYVEKFFDLMAVFMGYATIIYAFSMLSLTDGLYSFVSFSASFLLSYIFYVAGFLIFASSDPGVTLTSYDGISLVYFYFGQSFITQMLPAILIAFITHKLTKKGTQKVTSMFTFKNSIQKTMLVLTLVFFALNFVLSTVIDVWPMIKSLFTDGIIRESNLNATIEIYVNLIVFYLIMQYLVYYFFYKIYDNYIITHPYKATKENS